MKSATCLSAAGFAMLAVSGGWSYDTTISYTGGRQTGIFKLNGRVWEDSNRTDVPERAVFGMGLTVSHEGLPTCILSCILEHHTGILVQAVSGVSGFKNDSDIIWESAVQYPAILESLDSVQHRCFTGYVGDGWVVSGDQDTVGCAGYNFFIQPGYNRILYHRNGGVYLKIQVIGFEHDTAACWRGSPPIRTLCPISNTVIFGYSITDDSTGYFGPGPLAIRSVGKKAATPIGIGWRTRLHDFYELIRGRKPR